jgi:hypothetical protein
MVRDASRLHTLPALIAITITCLLLTLLAGCGGGGDGQAPTELTVDPGTFTARVGDLVPMKAYATYEGGAVREVTSKVTWGSDVPQVATVSASGNLQALAPGGTAITAVLGKLTSNAAAVTVQDVPTLPTAAYLPLKVGNQWEYTGTEVNPLGVKTSAVTITLTMTVSQQLVRDGEVWWQVLAKTSDPQSTPVRMYLRHDAAGLMSSETVGHPAVNLMATPLQAGKSWVHPEDSRRTYVIESTTETVTVPAGTYTNCVKVVETDTGYTPESLIMVWYKDGVGIVQEQVYAGTTLESEQKLVRLHVN